MVSISLCMIVKDEEQILGRCLDSIKDLVDEIIIVDTGSEDRTTEIAKFYTTNVFSLKWKDDFSAARNYSFSLATKDYILWLDADDVLLEDDREKFLELKRILHPSVDIVMMPYNVSFDEFGNVSMSYFRERLLKRTNNYIWKDPVHEYIDLTGKIINSDVCITHKKNKVMTDRNLNIFRKMVSSKRRFTPRNVYYYAKELYYNKKYSSAIKYYKKFLDTDKGWIEDNICACYELSKCYAYKKDYANQILALSKSFQYDLPRAEICCELGYYYKDQKELDKAVFWFETALRTKRPDNSWAFIMNDYWGYVPAIELCVCYYELDDIISAIECNNLAEEYKPQSPAVLYNKEFFDKIQK